jgi:endonuclease/exonuclease/phosphatase family metal-dependent hydrolase
MKNIFLFVLLLLFNFIHIQDKEIIRIMTYNVRVAFDKGENSWENRKENAASLIKMYNPDVVGLQEALKSQFR